jgi:hypothetical protein
VNSTAHPVLPTKQWADITDNHIYFLQLKETTEQRKNNQQSLLSWNLLKGKHHLSPIVDMRSPKDISGIMKSTLRVGVCVCVCERERERERKKREGSH